MNQMGQTNCEMGVLFKPLLSISMMRCRFLMFQHILRIPGNSCIYSICRKFTFNGHKITLVFDTSEYIVLEKLCTRNIVENKVVCYIFNSDYGDPCNISLERYLSLPFRELAIVTSK